MSWIRRTAAVAVSGVLAAVPGRSQTTPDRVSGWQRAGSHPQSYDVSMDKTVKHEERDTLRLSAKEDVAGFGTVTKSEPATPYLGKKLRLSAAVRAEGVRSWAGLWMRVDGGQGVLAFDNMSARPIAGTTEWRRYEVVLPVASEARRIAYGLLLGGGGKVWLDDVRLEVIPDLTASTAPAAPAVNLKAPTNLGFEE